MKRHFPIGIGGTALLAAALVIAPAGVLIAADGNDIWIVSLTFDDANQSQYDFVRPILANGGQKGVLYVPTALVGTEEYMTWPEVEALHESGWEIGAHGATHAELPEVSNRTEANEISKSAEDLLGRGLAAVTFATPFGAYDNDTLAAIAKRFAAHRSFHSQGYNRWPYNRYLLSVRYVTTQTSVAEVTQWVEEAMSNNFWLILVFHEILPAVDPDDTYSWRTDQLEEFIQHLNDRGITAKTVAEVVAPVQNLLPNGSFESGLANGWTADNPKTVQLNTAGQGSYPFPKNSIRMNGSAKASHLFSPKVGVTPGTQYALRGYLDSRKLNRGEVGFYMDEYDAAGNWISGQWLGGVTAKNVIDESYRYQPTSEDVAMARMQAYITAGARGSVYLDTIEFSAHP